LNVNIQRIKEAVSNSIDMGMKRFYNELTKDNNQD
jgi:hypothetical protein